MPAFFIVGDNRYEVPENMNMGEAYDVERYLGIDLSEARKVQTTVALLFIAWRRAKPDEKPEKIALEIRQLDMEQLDTEGEDEADPPALPPSGGDGEKKPISGGPSENGSDKSDGSPKPTGSLLSATDTSAPVSARQTSPR